MTPAMAIAETVRRSGTSFYWAMRVLPAPRRQAMFALYAFCRAVDDIADGSDSHPEKARQLQDWRSEIAALYRGEAATPIGQALIGPVRDFDLPRADFLAIIDGMAMDAEKDIVAPDLDDFDLYCDRVASAVGRLSVRIFGARASEAADRVAYHLGRALQMTNILRDLAEDGARGRLYLPRQILQRHNLMPPGADATPAAIAALLAHPALPAACRDLATMARSHFEAADRAMAECPRGPMRPARLMGGLYRAWLDRLIADDWRHLETPPRLGAWRKLWLALRHLP